MTMRRGPATMVPLRDQRTEDEDYSEPVSGRGGTRGPRRTLAQKIEDMQRELNELKWGGVKDAAAMVSGVVEALEDGEDKNKLFEIYRQMNELLEKNGMAKPVHQEG